MYQACFSVCTDPNLREQYQATEAKGKESSDVLYSEAARSRSKGIAEFVLPIGNRGTTEKGEVMRSNSGVGEGDMNIAVCGIWIVDWNFSGG